MFEVGMVVRVDNAPDKSTRYRSEKYGNGLFYNVEMNRYKGYDLVIKRVLHDEKKVYLDFLHNCDKEEVEPTTIDFSESIGYWVWHYDWLTPVEETLEIDYANIGSLL